MSVPSTSVCCMGHEGSLCLSFRIHFVLSFSFLKMRLGMESFALHFRSVQQKRIEGSSHIYL